MNTITSKRRKLHIIYFHENKKNLVSNLEMHVRLDEAPAEHMA